MPRGTRRVEGERGAAGSGLRRSGGDKVGNLHDHQRSVGAAAHLGGIVGAEEGGRRKECLPAFGCCRLGFSVVRQAIALRETYLGDACVRGRLCLPSGAVIGFDIRRAQQSYRMTSSSLLRMVRHRSLVISVLSVNNSACMFKSHPFG